MSIPIASIVVVQVPGCDDAAELHLQACGKATSSHSTLACRHHRASKRCSMRTWLTCLQWMLGCWAGTKLKLRQANPVNASEQVEWFIYVYTVMAQGVPIRLELGSKDLEKKSAVLARRDTGAKETVALSDVAARVPALLEEIHVRNSPPFTAPLPGEIIHSLSCDGSPLCSTLLAGSSRQKDKLAMDSLLVLLLKYSERISGSGSCPKAIACSDGGAHGARINGACGCRLTCLRDRAPSLSSARRQRRRGMISWLRSTGNTWSWLPGECYSIAAVYLII